MLSLFLPWPRHGAAADKTKITPKKQSAPLIPKSNAPVALLITVPFYEERTLRFPKPEEVYEPVLELAEVLAMGRHQVHILVGTTESKESNGGLETIKARVREIETKLKEENVIREKASKKPSAKSGNRPLLLKDEIKVNSFSASGELSHHIQYWMKESFSGATRAPFGTIALRGHGEFRDDGDLSLFFLTPPDTKDEGGLGLYWIAKEAIAWRAPLQIYWDMCQTSVDGDDKGVRGNSVAEKDQIDDEFSDQTELPLPDIVQLLRRNKNNVKWNQQPSKFPCNVLSPCFRTQKIDTVPEESSCHVIASGFRENPDLMERTELFLKTTESALASPDPSEANLGETFEHMERVIGLRREKKPLIPQHELGPIPLSTVVYSRRKDFEYEPVPMNLLTTGVCGHAQVGMGVSKDGSSFLITREKNSGAGSYALVSLNVGDKTSGFPLNEKDLWLEVVLSPEGVNGKGEIHYQINVNGAATPNQGPPLLSTGVTRTLTEQSGTRRVFIPLDKAKEGESLAFVSLVVIGSGVKTWPEGASIRILSMKTINSYEKQRIAGDRSELEVELDDKRRDPIVSPAKASLDLLIYWWPDTLLQRGQSVKIRREKVQSPQAKKPQTKGQLAKSPQSKSPQVNLEVKGKHEPGAYLGGIEGPIVPGAFVDEDNHRLKVRFRQNAMDKEFANAKVGVVAYGSEKVLCHHEVEFKGKPVVEAEINFTESGFVEYLSVALSGCESVTIESISIVPRK